MSDPWLPGYDVGTRFCREPVDADERDYPRLRRVTPVQPDTAPLEEINDSFKLVEDMAASQKPGPIEPRQAAIDRGEALPDGALFTDFYEPLRSDLTFLQAALSFYWGGPASDDVRGAWDRTISAIRNLGDVCADALNGEGTVIGVGELRADFVRALPGGKMDDSTFEAIEEALDRAGAPCNAADGAWLSLPERIAVLGAHASLQPDCEGRVMSARTFSELIRYWREDAGLSLSAAGKLAGITKAHLWELEQGRANNPSVKTLAGLARAYNASLPYLAHLAAAALQSSAAPAVASEVCASVETREANNDPL